MRINSNNLELAIARSCLTTRDIQKIGNFSNVTISKAKNNPNYQPTLKTIGKLAKALNVPVEYLIEKE